MAAIFPEEILKRGEMVEIHNLHDGATARDRSYNGLRGTTISGIEMDIHDNRFIKVRLYPNVHGHKWARFHPSYVRLLTVLDRIAVEL